MHIKSAADVPNFFRALRDAGVTAVKLPYAVYAHLVADNGARSLGASMTPQPHPDSASSGVLKYDGVVVLLSHELLYKELAEGQKEFTIVVSKNHGGDDAEPDFDRYPTHGELLEVHAV